MNKSRPARTLSFILCYIALGGVALLSVFLYPLLKHYVFEYSVKPELSEHMGIMLVLLYVALAIAAVTIISLLRLLTVVKRGQIFSEISLKLVTVIGCFVIAEALPLAAMGCFFLLSLAVAYVSATIGLCLLVVRGILKEAIDIKSENDATI